MNKTATSSNHLQWDYKQTHNQRTVTRIDTPWKSEQMWRCFNKTQRTDTILAQMVPWEQLADSSADQVVTTAIIMVTPPTTVCRRARPGGGACTMRRTSSRGMRGVLGLGRPLRALDTCRSRSTKRMRNLTRWMEAGRYRRRMELAQMATMEVCCLLPIVIIVRLSRIVSDIVAIQVLIRIISVRLRKLIVVSSIMFRTSLRGKNCLTGSRIFRCSLKETSRTLVVWRRMKIKKLNQTRFRNLKKTNK